MLWKFGLQRVGDVFFKCIKIGITKFPLNMAKDTPGIIYQNNRAKLVIVPTLHCSPSFNCITGFPVSAYAQ